MRLGVLVVSREKEDADPEVLVVVKLLPVFFEVLAKEAVGDLSQHASSIASDRVSVDRSSMSQSLEGLYGLLEQFM